MNTFIVQKTSILLLSLGFFSTAFAQKQDLYSQCVNKAGTTNNSVVSTCATKASNAYKKQINTSYNIIYKALLAQNPEDAKAFETSQKGWLLYRNNYCKLAGNYIGSPMYDYCPMKLNKTRSEELSEMASGF